MKSLTKKLLGIAIAATMVFACGATTLAAPAPDAQLLVREASTPIPCNQFNVGDTIEAGTTVSAIGTHSFCYLYFYESVEAFNESERNYNRLINGYDTWTADVTYLVVKRNSSSSYGGWCDLYLVPAPDSSETSESSLTPEQRRQLSVNEFVETLYERILGRTYDVTGRDYWVDQLMNHGATGADVVRGIISSAEFNPGDLSEEERVLELYRDLFNRIPSAGETANWTGAMKDGASTDSVLDYFLSSPEWEAICAYYCVNV